MYPGITTMQLDNLAAEIAVDMIGIHPDYAVLAARISVSNLQKETHDKFSQVMKELYDNKHPKTGAHTPLITQEFMELVLQMLTPLTMPLITNVISISTTLVSKRSNRIIS
jgi:ribonucleoside-diphosphate reductase subunit M1